MGSLNMKRIFMFLAFTLLLNHGVLGESEEEEDEDDHDDEEYEDDEEEEEEDHDDEHDDDDDDDDEEYSDEEYSDEEEDRDEDIRQRPPTLEEARAWWKRMPADARKKIAQEEYIKNEADKRFQIYLRALINEAEKIG